METNMKFFVFTLSENYCWGLTSFDTLKESYMYNKQKRDVICLHYE